MLLPPSVDSTHPFTQVAVICFTPTNDNNYHYINHIRETRGVGIAVNSQNSAATPWQGVAA
ncbi:unknown [Bacillus thuringiensis phage MZTP02]|uniref:Uncharacterized protein n=1 Tax=Bacillus thuringiensis phage MZTP02 TaxID=311221 RepID=Q56AR2_9CAUD|nr:unknown [Bacillus thuringiensis phage MZTP02]